MARYERDSPSIAFFRKHVDLWQRCGLSAWYVALTKHNPRVIDFYELKEDAYNYAPRAIGADEHIAVMLIPGELEARQPFTRARAGEPE